MKGIDKNIAISDLLYKSFFGKLSEDEQVMLDCWLKDEQNRKFYEELQEPEKLYEEVLEMADLDIGLYYSKIQGRMNHRRKIRLWLTIASAAAVLIPLMWMVLFLVPEQAQESEEAYRIPSQPIADQTFLKTETGKVFIINDSVKRITSVPITRKADEKLQYNVLSTSSRGNIEVTLSDSSRVWLNAGSRLRYPNSFRGNKREVELVGEAYFEVARNEQLPFVVKAGDTHIEVLGTQFNVHIPDGETCITTLVQGCVKVRNKMKDSVVIHPGQQVNTSSKGALTVRSVDPRFYTAWKRDRFAFQNEPFYVIMQQLSEWYGCTFEFSKPRLANLHFTTILPRYPEISEVLNVLQATGEFGYIESGNHICIVPDKDSKTEFK